MEVKDDADSQDDDPAGDDDSEEDQKEELACGGGGISRACISRARISYSSRTG